MMMAGKKNKIMLPNESSTLSFKKEEFMTDDFSVDKFVSECRKQKSLETMREELGIYLRVLHSAMVELINKDYADFVNLSSNLVGLDKSIKNLSVPLGQLKEEVLNVKIRLDEALTCAQKKLKEREDVHKNKVLVHRVMCILEGIEKIEKQNILPVDGESRSLSGELIERIAVEFNQVQFHMSKSSDLPLVNKTQDHVNQISGVLQQHLEQMFLDSLTNCDREGLHRVLHIYAAIDKIKEVEDKFCKAVVRPYMRQVITEDLIADVGIEKVYSYILDFIPSNCKILQEVTRGTKRDAETLKGYDFLVNSVWPEVVLCLEYIGPSIFAPGNPVLFHKNYSASLQFVSKFEHACMVQTSVKRLRKHPSYKSFMDKWNLLVYFQIRFQEIGGAFEISLLSAFTPTNGSTSYHLNSTSSLWLNLNSCWEDDVFLSTLSHKFWKLSLQLISRYCSWINLTIKVQQNTLCAKDNEPVEDSTAIPNASPSWECQPSNCPEETNTDQVLTTTQLVLLVQDIELLRSELQVLFKEKIQPKLKQSGMQQVEIAEEGLQECLKSLNDLPQKVGSLIVKQVTFQCAQHLKLVTDIPRLYRKTNREVPSKPSSYVINILKSLEVFLENTSDLLSLEWRMKWIQDILDSVTQQYLTVTTDVLTSVKKMEDSLKRLKRARDKTTGQSVSGVMTDDDKIRLQLVLDVEHFGQQIDKMGVNRVSVQSYEQLMDFVESARKLPIVNS